MSTYTIYSLMFWGDNNKQNRPTSVPYCKNDGQYRVKSYFQAFCFNNCVDGGNMKRDKKK